MRRLTEIFFDVDTQKDFMYKKGALYVPGAESIIPNLSKLTDYAREDHVLLLGSVDVHFGTEEYKHREGELQRWGGPFPDHCMDNKFECKYIRDKISGSIINQSNEFDAGPPFLDFFPSPLTRKISREQEKHLYSIISELNYWLTNLRNIPSKEELAEYIQISKTGIYHDRIDDLLQRVMEYRSHNYGIYFEKQSYNVFTNPNCEEFLKRAGVKRAVVYGVATDYCVKAAVLGMQKRGIKCYVVEDAIKGVDPETSKSALEEMVKSGADLVLTKDVLRGRI